MKYLLLALALVLSSTAFANNETYTMFCGNRAALIKLANEQGLEMTSEELKEITETRAPVLDILKNGNAGIQRVLEQGQAQDTGAFGVLIACGVINEMKDLIRKKGCTDLTTNRAIKDNGGIAACEEVMAKLPRS